MGVLLKYKTHYKMFDAFQVLRFKHNSMQIAANAPTCLSANYNFSQGETLYSL